MKLLKELARADVQQDLKTSDGSDAGVNDTAGKPVDVRFSLMRNMINTSGGVSGSDVNDYLERAHELNDEVDTVGFAIETEDGDFIKVYVNATQADDFEVALSNLLGMDDDSEVALNQLALKFDIVDVVWPTDPEGNPEDGHALNPEDDVSIDDDLSSLMGDDEVSVSSGDTTNDDTEADIDSTETDSEDDLGDALPADDDVDTPAEDDTTSDDDASKPKKSLMKDVAGSADDTEDDVPAPPADDGTHDGGPEKIDVDTDTDETDSTGDEDLDLDGDTGGSDNDDSEADPDDEELDDEGKPVKKDKKTKKKGEKEVTEEGLKLNRLAGLAESARDDISAHVSSVQRARGKFVIDCLMTGGSLGRRKYQYQERGEVKYFDTMEEAAEMAQELHTKRNHTLARATYTFTPRIVKEQEDKMSIGTKFLQRISEAEATPDEVKLDAPWRGISSRLKRPYEKKIVQLFSLLGVPGRYVQNSDGLLESIRASADVIRRPGRKQTAFNAFFDAVKASGNVAEAKRGGRLQKVLETVMVVLGFPEDLVSTEGAGPLSSVLTRAASKIESSSAAEAALILLAKTFGLTSKQFNEDVSYERASQGRLDAKDDWKQGWTEFDLSKDPEGKKLRSHLKSMIGGTDAYLDAYVAKTIELARAQFNEAKAFKARDPGWYVVDWMDKPVAGPFSETGAREEAKELNAEFKKKNAAQSGRSAAEAGLGQRASDANRGDIKAYDVLEFDETDIKRLKEEVDVGQDDFAQSVMQLVTALGIPEQILAPRRAAIIKALREKKMSLTNRTMVEQRMVALVALIQKGTRVQPGKDTDKIQEALKEGLLMEAFGSLEAMVDSEMKRYSLEEPLSGPAMFAAYEGGGSHEETVLTVGVDPDAESEAKALRVGVDGPWDGVIHAKYFPNTKEGYKAAIDYANLLRTWNAKSGGRPKGWKDAPAAK